MDIQNFYAKQKNYIIEWNRNVCREKKLFVSYFHQGDERPQTEKNIRQQLQFLLLFFFLSSLWFYSLTLESREANNGRK